eukprot:CAMPEP_0179883152 /NCGR_PEP_ID=MMETSP0982-20121206/28537_1 /TAXON_ID=483367 /ORGANISM="non described non described, Strain CCMP 2436" /LENGTH=114 /DNA_ID=CAMNT_0021777531 /DNA_START=660 /DNA_END=1004 /DNA_ORIENTATION=+
MNAYTEGAQSLPPLERVDKMRFLLHAAFHAVYAAAAVRGSKILVLTCVGGGVFGNPLELVAEAIAEAHAAWAGRTQLARVVLPLFGVGQETAVFEDALRSVAGVRAVVTVVDVA